MPCYHSIHVRGKSLHVKCYEGTNGEYGYVALLSFLIIWWFSLWVKVKYTPVQALTLCTGRTAHRGSRSIPLLFLDHGTRRGWEVSVTPRLLFNPRERPGTHCTGGWVGPRAGLDGRKISSPPGFDPGQSSPQSVATPTDLPGPLFRSTCCCIGLNAVRSVWKDCKLCTHAFHKLHVAFWGYLSHLFALYIFPPMFHNP